MGFQQSCEEQKTVLVPLGHVWWKILVPRKIYLVEIPKDLTVRGLILVNIRGMERFNGRACSWCREVCLWCGWLLACSWHQSRSNHISQISDGLFAVCNVLQGYFGVLTQISFSGLQLAALSLKMVEYSAGPGFAVQAL